MASNSNAAQEVESKDVEELDMFVYQDGMRKNYEQNCKIFFILRDFFLVRQVIVTGTVAAYIKKDDKHFFVIDDATGVITAVLWLNQ